MFYNLFFTIYLTLIRGLNNFEYPLFLLLQTLFCFQKTSQQLIWLSTEKPITQTSWNLNLKAFNPKSD